jgi:hypothetical protein
MLKMNQLESIEDLQILREDEEKADAKETDSGNEFIMQLLGESFAKGGEPGAEKLPQAPPQIEGEQPPGL